MLLRSHQGYAGLNERNVYPAGIPLPIILPRPHDDDVTMWDMLSLNIIILPIKKLATASFYTLKEKFVYPCSTRPLASLASSGSIMIRPQYSHTITFL